MRVRGTDPNRFARTLFDGLPSRYDLLAEVLSLGQNERWRREAVEHVAPAAPTRVLDVATGTAGVALRLVERTGAQVTGVDLTEEMLRRGAVNVARAGVDGRVRLLAGRAEQLPFPDASFDGLTFTYLLRYVDDPAATLRELARVVKPGAPVANLEFLVPPNRFWRRLGKPSARCSPTCIATTAWTCGCRRRSTRSRGEPTGRPPACGCAA